MNNTENLAKIDKLRETLEETYKTNTYGLMKIHNVVCSRKDLDNLYFITGLLKSGYSTSTISEDILTKEVRQVLHKTGIDQTLGDDYIEKQLKEKEKQINERTKARQRINESLDKLIKKDTLDTTLEEITKYKDAKAYNELFNKDGIIEEIRDAFKEFFSKAEDITLEEKTRIITELFSDARSFISSKVKLAELNNLEEEVIEMYLGQHLDKVNKYIEERKLESE